MFFTFFCYPSVAKQTDMHVKVPINGLIFPIKEYFYVVTFGCSKDPTTVIINNKKTTNKTFYQQNFNNTFIDNIIILIINKDLSIQ